MKSITFIILAVCIAILGMIWFLKPSDSTVSMVKEDIVSSQVNETQSNAQISLNKKEVEEPQQIASQKQDVEVELVDPKSDLSIQPIDPETDPGNQILESN